MPRVRTAKTVAKRIDLQYFTRPTTLRRARMVLSIALPVLLGGWFLAQRATGRQTAYSSGPLSFSHAALGNNCAVCHVQQADYRSHVEDKTCLGCHDAPVHHAQQTFTPACSSCHVEHQGRPKLSAVADNACLDCHQNLKTKDGKLQVYATVGSFDRGHPQFWPLRSGAADPGTIKLNHYVHLQPTLRGPRGPVQMVCDDCHRPSHVNVAWPYSVAVIQPATQLPVVPPDAEAQQRKRKSVSIGGGAYMQPIKYVNQCAACHVLQFDPRIPEPAPHDKPENVHAFIVKKYTDYIAAHPEARTQTVRIAEEPSARTLLRPTLQTPAPPPATAQEWVTQRVAEAENLLWNKNCKLCHAVTEGPGGGLPTAVKAIIPVRWLPRAEFDHQAHRMMQCAACHAGSAQSRLTSDINLPGIQTCRQCHQQAGSSKNAAEGRCFECHSYHDWRKEQPTKGRFTVQQLRASR